MSGVEWQRIKTYGHQLGIDRRLGSELGRLGWFGELSSAQTAAGFRVAEIYGRYERFNGLRRSARSPSYERGYGDSSSDEALDPVMAAERDAEQRDATAELLKLQSKIPRQALAYIEDLCVEDRNISPAVYEDVRSVLDRVAAYFGISSGGKKGGPSPKPNVIRKQSPVTPDSPRSSLAKRPSDIERIYWIEVLKRLRPDLSEKDLAIVYATQRALADRNKVRADKEGHNREFRK